jgi:hypothetical protein
MAKTLTPGVGMRGYLEPRSAQNPKKSKVYSFIVPKFGRFAFTRDPGEAGLFMSQMISTHLGAIHRGPAYSKRGQMRQGVILDEFDLGSGLVTNIGVTALANDSNWQTEAAEPINTLNVCKYINWGTGATAAAQTDYQLQTPSENESGKKENVAATSSVLKWSATGNAKIIITGKLEANLAGPTAITEWGLFSTKNLLGASTESEKSTVTSLEGKAAAFTASATKTRGEQNKVIWAEKSEEVYGLITASSTTLLTIPGWVKAKAAELGTTPEAKAKFKILPVMWDHRVFSAINVEKGNTIEFPYELEIKGGG